MGLVGATWQVTQRYIYTPYGVVYQLDKHFGQSLIDIAKQFDQQWHAG